LRDVEASVGGMRVYAQADPGRIIRPRVGAPTDWIR
jgi:hypothetical protein